MPGVRRENLRPPGNAEDRSLLSGICQTAHTNESPCSGYGLPNTTRLSQGQPPNTLGLAPNVKTT